MTETRSLRPRSPVHPGHFVRTVIVDPLGPTVTDAARALGITRVALSRFLNEQAALSPEMAIRLNKAFGADMGTLMRMQGSYDIAQARQRQGEIMVERYVGAERDTQTGVQ
ncbi:MAG: HigA family addiction module antitoxin [Geminicoccaceae bacterium]